jgi:glycosyltransferase involved in cell wall biosynthesis
MTTRLAIVVSHPIQHFCPQYASLAAHPSLEIMVFFASALGYKKYMDPDFNREISWGNLHLDEFPHRFLNDEKPLPANKDLDAPELEHELETFRPDILIVYGYFQKFQRRAYRWAKNSKVTLAYISDSERRRKRGFIRQWIKYPYVTHYFSSIDHFLSVGDANEEYYTYYLVPQKKIIRMHFSIDIRLYENAYSEKADLAGKIRSKFGLKPQDRILSVVGKLVESKNQGDIIDAMKWLEEAGQIFHLFVIGSGTTMEALQQKASALTKSRVYFPGFTNPEELPAYYAASDIYIHPASVDAHPLAVCEAIFMGCPVLISDRCGSYGPSDDVQEGKNGYVYRCGDGKDLAAKIMLLSDQDTRQKFGEFSHNLGVAFQKRSHGGFIKELIEKV